MSDDSHTQLVNHVEREEAEQRRWNALRSTSTPKRYWHAPPDRADDSARVLQYICIAFAIVFFINALF